MSFANYDLESQKPLNKRNGDGAGKNAAKDNSSSQSQTNAQNELDNIINNTSIQLQLFGNLISQFDGQRKLVATRRDSSHLRDNLDELNKKITDLGRAIQTLIQNLSHLVNKKLTKKSRKTSNESHDEEYDEVSELNITNRQVVIKERLVNEFNDLHKRFLNSIRQYNEKKLAFPIKTEADVAINENTPLIQDYTQQQQQQQIQIQEQEQEQDQINQTELQYHVLLTEERNREIEQVSQGIMEVNSIFKDLGELVHQQGEQLDTVEDNIFQMNGNVKQASNELRKADDYQRSKGKWSCILLVALCIVVLIVVLAVIS